MPTLAIQPDLLLDVTDEYDVLRDSGPGAVHRRPRNEKRRRVFRMEWKNAGPDIRNTLRALFRECCGVSRTFTFQPAGESDSTRYRFAADQFDWQATTAALRPFAVEIREAF